MKHFFSLLFFFLFGALFFMNAQTQLLDSGTNYPVAFATVSFGNGNGVFADDEGVFLFTEKLYPDIDTLYISALGYSDLKLPTQNLPNTINLEAFADELEEVSITALPKGKFKIEEVDPIFHDDYHKCWLPTIESEIAVFFPNQSQETKRITEVYIPIKLEAKDWRTRNRKNTPKKEFSTLFRIQFYNNDNGFPGEALTFAKMVFVATEKNEDFYTLAVKDQDIFIPEDGVFISVQVLGFTDEKGKLLPNKKYQEVKTRRGIVKVSTTFRPLLPFTDQITQKRTFVKRIFLNNGNWILFDKKNISNSNLLATGLNNYGIGYKAEVYLEN